MIGLVDKVGIGIFTPAQAATYARVSTSLLKRWLFGSATGEPVLRPEFSGGEDDPIVTFLDFVQVMAVRDIRHQFKIPLPKIRQAVETAISRYGKEFPFALQHKTFLMSDGAGTGHGEIIISVDDKMIQASGRERGNQVFKEVVELYLSKLRFGADGLAEKYWAWGTEEDGILMDPEVLFGEPYFPKTGISAQTLWRATSIEGSVIAAADAYEVPTSHVVLACEYFDHLQRPAA